MSKKETYVVLVGDEFTIHYNALGYHYEVEDVRKDSCMPLQFDTLDEAYEYMESIVEIAKYYTNKISSNVSFSKAMGDAKHELEKITSTNKSIIIPIIYDILFNAGKEQNDQGLYDLKWCLITYDTVKEIRDYYKEQEANKQEEEKA